MASQTITANTGGGGGPAGTLSLKGSSSGGKGQHVTVIATVSEAALAALTVSATAGPPPKFGTVSPMAATAGMTVGGAIQQMGTVSEAATAHMTVGLLIPGTVAPMTATAALTAAGSVQAAGAGATFMSGNASLLVVGYVASLANVVMAASTSLSATPVTTNPGVVMAANTILTVFAVPQLGVSIVLRANAHMFIGNQIVVAVIWGVGAARTRATAGAAKVRWLPSGAESG